MWIKADEVNEDHIIFEQGGSVNGWGMKISGGELYRSTRASSNEVTVTAGYTDTAWHHVAGVFKSGELHLYIDGQEVATENAAYQEIPAHAGSAVIGASYKSDTWGLEIAVGSPPVGYFQGVMDEIYYYSHALSANEINQLYLKALAVKPGGKLTTTWGEIK